MLATRRKSQWGCHKFLTTTSTYYITKHHFCKSPSENVKIDCQKLLWSSVSKFQSFTFGGKHSGRITVNDVKEKIWWIVVLLAFVAYNSKSKHVPWTQNLVEIFFHHNSSTEFLPGTLKTLLFEKFSLNERKQATAEHCHEMLIWRDAPGTMALVERTEDRFFRSIQQNPAHVLHHLLPLTVQHQYVLHPRSHNYVSNFIPRHLYKLTSRAL